MLRTEFLAFVKVEFGPLEKILLKGNYYHLMNDIDRVHNRTVGEYYHLKKKLMVC